MAQKPLEYLPTIRAIYPSGQVDWYNLQGERVAVEEPGKTGYDRIRELRSRPPYLPLSPCPYCGAFKDRNHDPMAHVNPKLGTMPRQPFNPNRRLHRWLMLGEQIAP